MGVASPPCSRAEVAENRPEPTTLSLSHMSFRGFAGVDGTLDASSKPTNICPRSRSRRRVLRAFARPTGGSKLERVMGIEPTTFSLGS